MSWLTPLGFLGLISLIVLIIIYLIKPNYQQRIISSTYVWKLSLRYRKKRVPINRFRNILIFICQVLILSSCAFILAQPIIEADDADLQEEKIIVIEASAGMHTTFNDQTRFNRAVEQAIKLVTDVFNNDGMVSVIIASDEPYFVAQRADSTARASTLSDLSALIDGEEEFCSYAVADVEEAMALAETILATNPKSEVIYYTGTDYIDTGIVKVENVSEVGEWNAAVLGCNTVYDENNYIFYIDVACFGKNKNLTVYCDVYNPNDSGEGVKQEFSFPVYCENDTIKTIELNPKNSSMTGVGIYSFDYAQVYVIEEDDFKKDDSFYVYGGRKPKLRVQYAGSKMTSFYGLMLASMRDTYSNVWDIEIVEVRKTATDEEGENEPELVGYDLYIFENEVPIMLPTDGVVLLAFPDYIPSVLDIDIMGYQYGAEFPLELREPHPITNYFDTASLSQLRVTAYQRLLVGEGFDVPLYINGIDPALVVKNTELEKVAILPISVNFSDLSVVMEFCYLFYNMMNYFLPATLTDYDYSIGETVTLNARGPELLVEGPNLAEKFIDFPAKVEVKEPGSYTLTQTLLSQEKVVENFFVRVDASESNIFKVVDELVNPYVKPVPDPVDLDLLIYFAIALVALLFIEWILQYSDV